jgi:hypothetical protein
MNNFERAAKLLRGEMAAAYWDMVDWRLFSTADLVTRKDHGSIFRVGNPPGMGTGLCPSDRQVSSALVKCRHRAPLGEKIKAGQ